MKSVAPATARRIGFAAAATLVGFLLLNLLAAGWEYALHGTFRVGGEPVGIWAPATPMHAGGRSLQPGAQANGLAHRFRVNAAGLRGEELRPSEGPNTVRIWCAGGSTTFDVGVSDDAHTWPARLEARLRAARPDLDVQVLNAGTPGGRIEDAQRELERLSATWRPHVVLLYHGPNDLGSIAAERFGAGSRAISPLSWLPLYRVLVGLVPPPAAPAEWADHRIGAAELGPMREATLRFLDAVRRTGAAPVLSSHAFAAEDEAAGWDARLRMGREARVDRMSAEAAIAAYRAFNMLFAAIAREQGLPFVDVRAAVPPDSSHFIDGMHFNDRGAEAAAQSVADALLRAGLRAGGLGAVAARPAPAGPPVLAGPTRPAGPAPLQAPAGPPSPGAGQFGGPAAPAVPGAAAGSRAPPP